MHKGPRRIGRPSPAMIVAIIALIASLSGSAYAALGKNSVGSRQLKSQAVKTGKIANNAVNGRKVANNSLSGEDINLSQLGTVPAATTAGSAGNANTVSGHAAACPPATTLIRGTCFDSSSNPVASSVTEAADKCAAKGGYLPGALELYATRTILNLGTGVGTDNQFTSAYYANTNGSDYNTIVVNGTGALIEQEVENDARYTCAY
ncbi:MAG TPA: hypothetical protein VFS48_00360, partial [Solirubrobacterales bacterium]|nr:hypothetical protein [Solirubrobacterales bacterium]